MKMFNFRYKNIILLLIGIIVAIILVKTGQVDSLALKFGQWGYLGSFILGVMYFFPQ